MTSLVASILFPQLVELENFFDEDMLRQPKAKKQPKISRASKGNGAGADDVTDVDASDGGNGGGKTKAKAKDKGVKKVPKVSKEEAELDRHWGLGMTNQFVQPIRDFFHLGGGQHQKPTKARLRTCAGLHRLLLFTSLQWWSVAARSLGCS